MIETNSYNNLVAVELEKFLQTSRLSMTGLAKKLQISKAQLSLIKNNKKTPSLDLGLKILKYTGTNSELRKEWALDHLSKHSDEYEELENSVKEELKKIKLAQSICDRFENNLTLMNLYLDIVNADNGITVYSIERNYGKESLHLVDALISAGLISKTNEILKAANTRTVLTKRSSYNFMKTIFDDQRDKFDAGTKEGKFQFIMDDVDAEGQKKLEELLMKTMKEAGEILKSHECPRSKGGKRVIFQVLSAMVKGPMLVLVLILTSTGGWAGGVEGGSAPVGGVEGGSSAVVRMRTVSDLGKYKVDEKIIEWKEQIQDQNWNDLKEKAYEACNEKYRMTSRSHINLNLNKLYFDRYWIERVEHNEANAEISVQCSKNLLPRKL